MAGNPYEHSPSADSGSPGSSVLKWLAMAGILVVAVLLFLPVTRQAGPAARRTQCRNNLTQIMLALHNYHDVYASFPPAYTVDAEGNRLHSWRTLILPYLDQANTYGAIDLSKPWDDPVNAEAAKITLPAYTCPSATLPEQHTTYCAITGNGTIFPEDESRSISETTDGCPNTIAIVEVPDADAVHWMSPDDHGSRFFTTYNEETETAHEGAFLIGLADGSIRSMSLGQPPSAKTRMALMTVDGGEMIGDY